MPTRQREVDAFLRAHHRHHPPTVGFIAHVAVADAGGQVVGVAVLGRPSARALDDGWSFEVTRTCTDGHRNANSALYGAAWRVARALGYRRGITYTQDGESGASLRAAGWLDEASLRRRAGWDMPGRARDNTLHPTDIGRTRWVALADPPPWPERPSVPRPVAGWTGDGQPDLFDEDPEDL